MHLRAPLLGIGLGLGLVVACAGGDAGDVVNGGTTPPPSGSPDASGQFVFGDDAGVDAGPLLSPCDPTSETSCPTGFVCFATHTSTSWWVDLYGKCTFDCSAATLALCSSMDGVCGCPVASDGTPEVCTDEEEGGTLASEEGGAPTLAPMVCIPAVVPGHSVDEGDGGCGTPGCGGGAPVNVPEGGASEDASDQ